MLHEWRNKVGMRPAKTRLTDHTGGKSSPFVISASGVFASTGASHSPGHAWSLLDNLGKSGSILDKLGETHLANSKAGPIRWSSARVVRSPIHVVNSQDTTPLARFYEVHA